jgi:hypothetical protein
MHISKLFLLLIILSIKISAQNASTDTRTEVNVIDSYISPESPVKFVLSFFTTDSCKSKLKLLGNRTIDVSKTFEVNHRVELELHKLRIDSSKIKYQIIVFNREGIETKSEIYEVELPKKLVIPDEQNPGLFKMCCLGGIIFGMPSPTYVSMNKQSYAAISKEIPLISIYSIGYNYPAGYFGIEYTYVFNAQKKNFARFGYKQIIQIPGIQYISPGANLFTDFLGYNGVGLEISAGLFQVQNVFTIYARYRYNFQFEKDGIGFHEISIGIYSNFFSLNL